MSDIKISQLPQSTQLTGSEIVPMDQVQGGNLVTVKATAQDIADLASLGYTAENVANKSTDGTFSANSDTLYPSQKATKTYVDAAAVGLLKDNGNYDPTATSQYPTSANTLSGGNPQKGDIWYISANGTINGHAVLLGYSVRALVNNAGATNDANWSISNVGLGYIPENVDNKSTDVNLGTSDTLYPTQNAVKTYVDANAGGVPTLQQVIDGDHTLVSNNNFQGTDAGGGESFSGAQVNAFGYKAAYDNIESNINALGSSAAEGNSGADVNGLGNSAAKNNSGQNVNAFGSYAGADNTFSHVNLLGANTVADGNFQTVLSAASGSSARISTLGLTNDRKYTLPDKSGTLATIDDVSGWGLLGNAGTDSSVNFIGTTDDIDLVIKRNNKARIKVTTAASGEHGALIGVGGLTIYSTNYDDGFTSPLIDLDPDQNRIQIKNAYNKTVSLAANDITDTRNLELPNKNGTLAIVETSAFTGTKTIGGQVYTWENGILMSVV